MEKVDRQESPDDVNIPHDDSFSDASSGIIKPAGVRKVEAAQAAWGPKSKWFLFIGIALSAYVYSLDGMTSWMYLQQATSSLGLHSSLGTVAVANSIMIAVGKPFMAKLSDVFGRGETMLMIAILYAVGYAIMASSNSLGQLSGGSVIYSMGYTGLQLVMQIIIADVTSLRWRALVSSLVSLPFMINAFVSANVYGGVLAHTTWRWGYGMFAIIMPCTLLPIIAALLWSQRKGKKLLRSRGDDLSDGLPFKLRAVTALRDMDFVGLILVAFSLSLILLPFTLVNNANGKWKNPSMIAMVVIGVVIFPIFIVYEWLVPARPVVPMRWLRRLPILGACLIGFFDFISFYLQYTYLFSYIMVTQDWTPVNQGYFASTQTLALTFFAIMAGGIMYLTRRFKWMLVTGLCIRLMGVGIMFHARGPNGNTASLVMCQVLQGVGGGIAAIATQTAAQASVSHVDVATVTAMFLLLTEVGNSVGSATAAGVWTQYMPGELAKHVPGNNATLVASLYGDITQIIAFPANDPTRLGAIAAYQAVMHRLLLGSVIVAIFPILFAIFLIKDIKLTDAQNAYDGKDVTGKQIEEADASYSSEMHEAAERARRRII